MQRRVTKKIRKDDNVIVIAGNCRGMTGKVIRILGHKVFVQGVNVRKKHVRATRTSKGGIVDMEMPIHVSNLKVCDDHNKPVKLRVQSNDGIRQLVYGDSGSEVVYRQLGRK